MFFQGTRVYLKLIVLVDVSHDLALLCVLSYAIIRYTSTASSPSYVLLV